MKNENLHENSWNGTKTTQEVGLCVCVSVYFIGNMKNEYENYDLKDIYYHFVMYSLLL